MSEVEVQESVEVLANSVVTSAVNVWSDTGMFDQMARKAQMLSNASIIPQNYQGKPADCFIALEMAIRMNLSPLFVMQNMYPVKGKPSWAGQACTTLIKNCGEFRNVRHVYTGTKGTDSRGCYVEAVRVRDGEVVQGAEVTMQMAKNEGWMSNSKWKNMPELMLAYRASAFFARVHCPEALMGVQTDVEVYDAELSEKSTAASLSEQLQKRVAKAGKVGENNG